MRKIKIAYIVNSLNYGGVEKYTVDLVNNVDYQKFEPCIVCFKGAGPLAKSLNCNGEGAIFEMHKRNGNDFYLPFRMAKLFHCQKTDIIHSNNWGTFVESVLAKKLSGARGIVHVQHGLEFNDAEAFQPLKRKVRNITRHIFSLGTDQIVTVSSAGKRFVTEEWGVPKSQVRLIYNGVDLNRFRWANKNFKSDGLADTSMRTRKRLELGLSEDDLIVGSVGRLMQVKNYPCLIKAMQYVVNELPKTKLIIAGDGSEREKIASLIKKLGLIDKVKLLGRRSDVPELLCSFDIFSLSSISEGMSLSILEAMSAGLPVVATNVGGNPEIVQDGKTGILVESDNSRELADSIIFLLKNPEKRRQMGFASRKRVEEIFSLQKMISEYEELYLSLVAGKLRRI